MLYSNFCSWWCLNIFHIFLFLFTFWLLFSFIFFFSQRFLQRLTRQESKIWWKTICIIHVVYTFWCMMCLWKWAEWRYSDSYHVNSMSCCFRCETSGNDGSKESVNEDEMRSFHSLTNDIVMYFLPTRRRVVLS